MRDKKGESTGFQRRRFLKMAGGAAAVTALGGLGACAPQEKGIAAVEVPLDSLPVGGRLRILYGEMPVELIREGNGVKARSLWCTHSGCEVKWRQDQEIYFCACHDGKYDAQGQVLAGPPPRPLGEIPITVTETKVRVGEPS